MLSRQAVSRVAARMSSVKIDMMPHGVASLAFNAPPVNTLNKQLLSDIKTSVDQVVADGASAIVFSSAKPGVFSSGLDIFSMYGKSDDELREFWQHVQVRNILIPIINLILTRTCGCQFTCALFQRLQRSMALLLLAAAKSPCLAITESWQNTRKSSSALTRPRLVSWPQHG